MAKTAVLNKEDKTLIKVVDTAEEKKEFDGRDDVIFMVKKNFEPTSQFQSWDEMIGKVKPVEQGAEGQAEGEAKAKREPAAALEGNYYLLKPLPAVAEDHPKKPIWDAIRNNDGGTCEDAKAACPAENPKRKTNGVYTFASEFRYFLKTGYVALGVKPEGFDYTAEAEAKAAEKAKAAEAKPKKSKAKKETTEQPQAAEGEAGQEQAAA